MANRKVEEDRNAFFARAHQLRQAIASGRQWFENHMHDDTPEARKTAEDTYQERVLEAKQRRGRDFGDLMFRAEQNIPGYKEISKKRSNGESPVYDLTEVVGEIPTPDVPVQLIFEKHELNPPGPRFMAIKEGIRKSNEIIKGVWEDHRAMVVLGVVAGAGTLIIGIGARRHFKHILKDNPHADITNT